jgi:hypothetical protein
MAGQQGQAGVQPFHRAAVRVGQLVQHRLGHARPPVDRVQQHLVGPGQRAGLGVPDEDLGVGRQAEGQLGDQPGLPDTGLPSDDHHLRPTRRGELRQSTKLAVAADHHRTVAIPPAHGSTLAAVRGAGRRRGRR